MKKISTILFLIALSTGAVYAAIAAKGVFTVDDEGKKVQFANANESGLMQWSTASTWSEAHKDDDGHNGWYVLNYEEWTYLLVTRDSSLNYLGTVNGDSGLIILPDGWVQPAGIPRFTPVGEGILYANNIYTSEQWAVMAEAGAIFLPCAGYGWMDGSTYKVEDPTDHGSYWSSSPNGGDRAYCTRFYNYTIHDQNNDASQSTYRSVILVKTVTTPELDETHEAEAFTIDLAAATGKSYAYVKRTLNKDGTLYTLCLPFDVPNVDASPLAGAENFEFEGGRVLGEEGHEVLSLNLSSLSGKRLTQGVPYILRWEKTTPVDSIKRLCFYNVENWDDNTDAATDPGDDNIKFHGVYPKAHIPGYTSGSTPHYNFFIGANNTLYWPDDATYGVGRMMRGFRAYFYIVHEEPGDPAPRYRNMPAVWNIDDAYGSTTDMMNEGVKELRNDGTKLFHDGQIVLIIDGVKYDMWGRRVER